MLLWVAGLDIFMASGGKNWVSNGTLFGTFLSPCGVEESVA